MVIAKSGHLSTHQSQRLHSIGFTAMGKPSSSSTNTLREHNSIQILHRLHHLSNIWMDTLGYLLFFFFTLYLTFVFLDNTKTLPQLSFIWNNDTNPYCLKWSRWNWWIFLLKWDAGYRRFTPLEINDGNYILSTLNKKFTSYILVLIIIYGNAEGNIMTTIF